MPTTDPTFGWPVPEDADPLADGASAIRQLAAGIAGTMQGLTVQGGVESFSISNSKLGSRDVTFPVPFTAPPVVVAVTDNTYWNAQARNVTATQFQVGVRHILDTNQSSASVDAHWLAFGPVA